MRADFQRYVASAALIATVFFSADAGWIQSQELTSQRDEPNSAADLRSPQFVPSPGEIRDGVYHPTAILPGGVVIPLYPPDSPYLHQEKLARAEVYNMSAEVPGRINSIIDIHNPSIEVHRVPSNLNTGAVVILAAGGGHKTLNVGSEAADLVPYFYNYGVNAVILRNRLRSDGYEPKTDAVRDAMQAIRLVRKHADRFGFDPAKIGIMGFSAGAELAAPAALVYERFDAENGGQDPLAEVSSRPNFVTLVYPGPTPFARGETADIPEDAPPSFVTSPGSGDRVHAVWGTEFFAAMLQAGVPNVEIHIYASGFHPGTNDATAGITHRKGIPFGTWQERHSEWLADLGFLGKPGVETKAAADVRSAVEVRRRR